MQVIDADGHVNDGARSEELVKYMPKGCRASQVFPILDHLHFHYLKPTSGQIEFGNPGPREWLEFMERTEIDWAVLYPTWGLAMGRFVSVEWAVAACRAYNNWLYDTFLNHSPKLKGMALIPIQDVDTAVVELRRAVKQLGMIGAMLPSNGNHRYSDIRRGKPVEERVFAFDETNDWVKGIGGATGGMSTAPQKARPGS